MATYEVFLPASKEGDFNLTLQVQADTWMAALKAGLKKLGEQGAPVASLLVDVTEDNSIHVTDTAGGRVFRIKELEGAHPPAPIPLTKVPPPAWQAGLALGERLPGDEAPTPIETPVFEPPAATPAQGHVKAPPPSAKPAASARAPASQQRVANVAQAPVKPAEPARPGARADVPHAASGGPAEAIHIEQIEHPSQPITGTIGRARSSAQVEDVLADLFERTQDVFALDREKGLAYLLDLALQRIPAESGSVFVADFAANGLELKAARGPKASELQRMKLRLPLGVGIVGFCAQEAVSLAISDTEKDPRFYRAVSRKIGYETRSILCAPMVSDGRTFGCIEVINKKGTSQFTQNELAILAYVAHQGAKYLKQFAG